MRGVSYPQEFDSYKGTAICLHGAHSENFKVNIEYVIYILNFIFIKYFQIAFNQFEKLLLHDTKFSKLIIVCIKYFIKLCKPYLKSITSHAIKSVVMNTIFENPHYFDHGRQLEEGFLECFDRLQAMICSGFIPDIIFPEVNVYRYNRIYKLDNQQ